MAKDPRDAALMMQVQSDLHDVEAGGKTSFTDALHASLNMVAVRCAQAGLLDADDLDRLGFASPKAKIAGPHPMDGGSGGNKNPN